MIVEILETDKWLGLKKGEWYLAEPFSGDPESRVELKQKISKKNLKHMGENLMCTQYRYKVKILVP